MDALLTDLYYNEHLTSIKSLYPEVMRVKPANMQVTQSAVLNWMKQQTAQQQTKRVIHEDKPVTTLTQTWGVDLAILSQFARVGVRRRRQPAQAPAVQLPIAIVHMAGQPQADQEGEEEDVGAILQTREIAKLPARNRRKPRRDEDEGYGSGLRVGGSVLKIGGRDYNMNDRFVNGDMSVLFTAIHLPTRYLYLYPQKGKSAEECTQSFRYWLEDLTRDGFPPITYITSDAGKEWEGPFARLVAQNNITHTKTVGGGPGVSIVNACHSALKKWMLKQMLMRGSVKWIDLIQPYLVMYNTKRKHSGLKLKDKDNRWQFYTPEEFKNSTHLQSRLHSKKRTETAAILAKEHHWKVGDSMRIQEQIDRGYIKATTIPLYSKKTYPVLSLKGFQLEYPGDAPGSPTRWIARRHALWVPGGVSNSHTNTDVDDERFHRLVRDNRRQRQYDADQRQLQIG